MKQYEFLEGTLYSAEDLMEYYDSEERMRKDLDRLIAGGRVTVVADGLYATVNPVTGDIYSSRYEIAQALFPGSYCAYHTALEYYGLTTQIFKDVQIACREPVKPVSVRGLDYAGVVVDYEDGVDSIVNCSPLRITDKERTLVDCMDRMDLCGGLNELKLAVYLYTGSDEEKLLKHLRHYNDGLLYKKAGYLFSRYKVDRINCGFRISSLSSGFFDVCRQNMSKTDDILADSWKGPCVYNEEWKLYVPAE
ncbi:MAG: hypothetical protein LUD51_04820 [Clostridia bacterium]|nr:hypothetical protein [Clostridia bacterium]